MKRVLLCSVMALVLLPGLASAGFSINALDLPKGSQPSPQTFVGDVVDVEIDYPNQTCVLFGWISGTQFLAPNVLTNFTPVSWGQTWASPTYALAAGPAVNAVMLNLNFAETLAEGSRFAIASYDANGWIEGTDVLYSNQEFIGETSDFGVNGKPVPEPATWLTLLAGVGVLGIVRYRAA